MKRNVPLNQEELAAIIEEVGAIEYDISEDKDGESTDEGEVDEKKETRETHQGDDKINARKLVVNVQDVGKRATHFSFGVEEKELMQQQTVLTSLLACPTARKIVAAQKPNAVPLSTVPELDDNTVSLVVRALGCQRGVLPIFSCLSMDVICHFIINELKNLKNLPPVPHISLVSELTKALFYKLHQKYNSANLSEALQYVTKLYDLATTNFDCGNSTKGSYTFLHQIELFHSLSVILMSSKLSEPVLLISEVRDLFDEGCINSDNTELLTVNFKALLQICNNSVKRIAVDNWVSWSEVTLNEKFYCPSQEYQYSDISVQTVISFIAHNILQLMNPDALNGSEQDFKRSLVTVFTECNEFSGFLRQVAQDPNFDPLSQCKLPELISLLTTEINLSENDKSIALTKKGQRILELVISSNGNELFSSEEAAEILLKSKYVMSTKQAERLLNLFMMHEHVESNAWKLWKEVALKCCGQVSSVTLGTMTENILKLCGGVCRDWMDSASYSSCLTSVCNTMAADSSTSASDTDLLSASRVTSRVNSELLWLAALQRPVHTVTTLVQQGLSLPGIAAPVVFALQQLAPICRASQHVDGVSLLTEALAPYLMGRNLPSTKEREIFYKFIRMLFAPDTARSSDADTPKSVAVRKIFDETVHGPDIASEFLSCLLPSLQWTTEDTDLNLLDAKTVPLTVLKILLQCHAASLLPSQSPTEAAALVLALLKVHHNLQCCIFNQSASNAGAEAFTDSKEFCCQVISLIELARDILKLIVNYFLTSPRMEVVALLRRYLIVHLDILDCTTAALLTPLMGYRGDMVLSEALDEDIELQDGNTGIQGGRIGARSGDTQARDKDTKAQCVHMDTQSGGTHDDTTIPTLAKKQLLVCRSLFHGCKLSNSVTQLLTAREWTAILFKALYCAPQSTWLAAAKALVTAEPQKLEVSADSPPSSVRVLRDVLHLCNSSAGHAVICYQHCSSAIMHAVKLHSERLCVREQLCLVSAVFVWWCHNHVISAAADLPCLLLLKLLDHTRQLIGTQEDSSRKGSDTRVKSVKKPTEKNERIVYIEQKAIIGTLLEPFLKYMDLNEASIAVSVKLIAILDAMETC